MRWRTGRVLKGTGIRRLQLRPGGVYNKLQKQADFPRNPGVLRRLAEVPVILFILIFPVTEIDSIVFVFLVTSEQNPIILVNIGILLLC